MPGPGGHATAVARVGRLCDAADDARSLRLALIDALRRAVGFDAYAWLLTDPETAVGVAPLADVPWLPDVPRQIALKYLTPVNRWTSLDGPVATLRRATGEQPERSLLWRELLATHGVHDVASAVFRDRFGCWAFLELFRIGSGPTFGDRETGFLSAIEPTVTAALRRCQAATFGRAPAPRDRAGPVVLVLSSDLEVRAQTPDTEEYLRILVPPDGDRRPVPSSAYNVAAQLLAVEAGVDAHPPRARVHMGDGVWLTLRAARIDTDIAVTIETTSPAERMDLFARACALTRRETELLGHVAAGLDTRAIAAAMFVSEHTVQDHLKSIFAKTGAADRRVLTARATGR